MYTHTHTTLHTHTHKRTHTHALTHTHTHTHTHTYDHIHIHTRYTCLYMYNYKCTSFHPGHLSNASLYCSEVTRSLLLRDPDFSHLAPFLKGLPMEEALSMSLDAFSDSKALSFTVTLLPAGHCPGSAMCVCVCTCVRTAKTVYSVTHTHIITCNPPSIIHVGSSSKVAMGMCYTQVILYVLD